MDDLLERLAYLARCVWCRIVGHKPYPLDRRVAGITARPFCDRCDADLGVAK